MLDPKETFNVFTQLRRAFYNTTFVKKNPGVQRNGFVFVAYSFHNGRGTGRNDDSNYKLPKVLEALPVRVVAFHLCHDHTLKEKTFAMVKAGFDPSAQIRIRSHFGTLLSGRTVHSPQWKHHIHPLRFYCFVVGSHEEVMASLQGHGIEPGVIPIAEDGTLTDLEDYHRRLNLQRREERRSQPQRRVIHVPGEHDVLFGKGSPFQNHSGNKALRSLILAYQERYHKAEKGNKIKVAQEIVDTIEQSSGLFLRQEGSVWVVVENKVAKNKVSTAFRTLKMDQKRFRERRGSMKNA